MDSDWANLPEELLDSILRLVLQSDYTQSDYIQFSRVCMSWYCVAKDIKRHPSPMVLIHTAKKDIWNLYNVMFGNVLDLQFKLPKKRFCGYAKGWLIGMNFNLVVTLINLSFMVKGRKKRKESFINLPPLDKGDLHHEKTIVEFVVKATISADPILDANNCVVVVIYEGSCKLAFIRLNKDTTWTYVDPRLEYIGQSLDMVEDVVHVKEKFYAVKGGGQLFSFDIITQSKQLVAEGMQNDDMEEKVYLVVLNDKELWMVRRYVDFGDEDRVTKKVRIYELDFDKHEWVEKETLGDVALFLGDNFSISVLASNFLGCRPNCIYFNHDHDRYCGYLRGCLHHDFGVYDVKSQSFSQSYAPNITALMKTTKKPPYWVVPTFQL
ncbi:hypothetical protein ACE6H2_008001 [Prunus campanulata]